MQFTHFCRKSVLSQFTSFARRSNARRRAQFLKKKLEAPLPSNANSSESATPSSTPLSSTDTTPTPEILRNSPVALVSRRPSLEWRLQSFGKKTPLQFPTLLKKSTYLSHLSLAPMVIWSSAPLGARTKFCGKLADPLFNTGTPALFTLCALSVKRRMLKGNPAFLEHVASTQMPMRSQTLPAQEPSLNTAWRHFRWSLVLMNNL